jgi:hypothetical protein
LYFTGQNNKAQFAKPGAAQKAAALLGLPVEELLRQVFSSSGSGTLTPNRGCRGHNHMVVGFTTTCASSAYHH